MDLEKKKPTQYITKADLEALRTWVTERFKPCNQLVLQYADSATTSTYVLNGETYNVEGNRVDTIFTDAPLTSCSSAFTKTDLVAIEQFPKTSNVTDMRHMFYYCPSLTSLDLSKWDTSNVTNMGHMFYYCDSLTSLDLSKWDTSNVTNMGYMFSSCSGLTSLDVSKWDTSNVTNMGYMFSSCSGLTSLDVSGWDMANVTDMRYMFGSCSALATIYARGCNEATITKLNSAKPSGATIVTV